MNIVFMGTPQFAVVSLKKLLEAKFNITAVVTAPDKQKGRGLRIQPSAVKQEALKHGITVLQPEKLKGEEFLSKLKGFNPDLIIVVAFRILPESVFGLPPLGTINLHGSLLPKYRGAAPINWAIINGESETGVTTIFINKQVDTGNVIQSRKVKISENMTAGELHDKMAVIGSELLIDTCHAIKSGNVKPKIQDDKLASAAPKIFKEHCNIDFKQSAQKVHNFIRGLSPFPGAYSFLNGKMIKLFNSRVSDINDKDSHLPGTILDLNDKTLIIRCLNGSISVAEIQVEGKRRMKIAEYLRGHKFEVGTQLKSDRG